MMLDEKMLQAARVWITAHSGEMVQDLIRLVAVPSVSDPEDPEYPPFGKACRDVEQLCLEMAAAYGFETESFGHYCARASIGSGEELAFWSHLDVVPAGEGWRYDPFQAIEREGYVIGRGTQDNKGSAVSVLYLMRFLRETGYPLRHRLTLYVGFSEENGMADAAYFARTQKQPPLSIVADCGFPVCVGERGTLTVRLKARRPLGEAVEELKADGPMYMLPETAVLRTREPVRAECGGIDVAQDGRLLTAHGVADHAAAPGDTPNALYLLADAACKNGLDPEGTLAFLRDAAADPAGTALGIACADEASGPLVCGVTTAGLEEGRLWFTVSCKFPVTKTVEELLSLVRATAEKNGFETEALRTHEPVHHAKLGPVVRGLTDIYNEVMGVKTEPFVMSGGTYARELKNALPFGTGMPMPPRPAHLFAPGHGDYHQANKSIETERMQKACLIYAASVFWLDTPELSRDIYG